MKKVALITKLLLTIVVSIIIGSILMSLIYLVPTDRAFVNVQNSINMFTDDYIRSWSGDYRYGNLDNSTDVLMIDETIYRPYSSSIDNAMLNPYCMYKDMGKRESLVSYADGLSNDIPTDYSRYWHGYLLYLIPGFYFFDIGGMRAVMMIVVFFITLAVLYELDRRNSLLMLLYGVVVLFLNPITISMNYALTSVYFVSTLITYIVLKFNEWLQEKNRYLFLFLISGILTSFFDFLTYPLVTIGVPLTIAICINNDDLKTNFKNVVVYCICWVFGYAGMWAGKWIIASILTGTNVIESALASFAERTSNDVGSGQTITYFDALSKIRDTFDKPMTALLLLGFVFITFNILLNKKNNKFSIKNMINYSPILLIGIIPFVWYFVLQNHTYIHPWYEYRQLAITIISIYFYLGKLFIKK